MKYMAIEYGSTKGYIRIPDTFPGSWSIGYIRYLRVGKKITDKISIYQLNIHTNSETMAKDPAGFTNLEDEFKEVLRDNEYYPPCPEVNFIRREWAKFFPSYPDFVPRKTWLD